ncbi:YdcF family protein [Sediminibacterium roseum]|uniref:YdcF family protein n=1 Tax=Sediminibacterium roseum TaxID=1978412 RepID=A0ABW9ZU98_9BACT|nr:YdcF family protein [Sediminibacterium roseum]NCI48788.1 YdcF family protein [Sediminibacterium roseum]
MFPRILATLVLLLHITITFAGQGPRADYKFVEAKNIVQRKNYYLLTLFDAIPEVRRMLGADEVLKQMATTKTDSVRYALQHCERDGLCYTSKLKFSEEDIKTVGNRLRALYKPGNALDRLVQQHLVPSGCYILFQSAAPVEMLVKAWEQDAMGVNFCIGVYAEGRKPNYPLIDSISFNTRDARNPNGFANGYVSLLYNTTSLLSVETTHASPFYQLPLMAAAYFLEMNERGQAADFEPMEAGENRAAVQKIKTTDWSKYKYTVILVPGAGPEDPRVALSAEGMLRCRLAALQYKQGLAPFVVVSGGKVHPYKTVYCEATEMKKFMVETLQVPASAIIIDPHARHTTTNMRNTARLMYRYGIPMNRPGIATTTRGQSTMIGTTLVARCLKELNEAPYRNGTRLSETSVEFYPLPEALHINPTEPLDP